MRIEPTLTPTPAGKLEAGDVYIPEGDLVGGELESTPPSRYHFVTEVREIPGRSGLRRFYYRVAANPETEFTVTLFSRSTVLLVGPGLER